MNFPENYYLNFHAHQQMPDEGEIVIQSLFLQDDLITRISDKIFFTAGLHPWHADALNKNEIRSRLDDLIKSKTILAVGETGIDKLKGPDLDIQIDVFKTHVKIADDNNLPLIIHSVKAHNEIFKLKKELKSKVPWVIHHFNGSKQMAFDLIESGFYLSVCHHIKSSNSKLSEYFRDLPLEKIFLETDDFRIDIKNLYELAALKIGISVDTLKKQLILNLKNLLNE
ncbi:TatD family hydrolase [Bacteroidota bacterium]